MPPRVDRVFIETVVYLFADVEAARASATTGGTGFILTMPLEFPGHHVPYLVTNAHVAERCGAMRINLSDRTGFDVVEVSNDAWIFHPDGDDLAVCELDLIPEWQRWFPSAVDSILRREDADDFGPGDDVFYIGRQLHLGGKSTNTPTVRFGAISMMEAGPLTQPGRDRHEQESIVVEARSLGGYSGAPVYAYKSAHIGPPQDPVKTPGGIVIGQPPVWPTSGARWLGRVAPLVEGPLTLLGVVWGHMDASGAHWGDVVWPNSGLGDIAESIKLNSGMMLLVPAWKIMDILMGPELSRLRRQYDLDLEQEASARPTQTEGAPEPRP